MVHYTRSVGRGRISISGSVLGGCVGPLYGIGGGKGVLDRDRWGILVTGSLGKALDPGSMRRVEGPLYGLGGEFLATHRRDKGISIP